MWLTYTIIIFYLFHLLQPSTCGGSSSTRSRRQAGAESSDSDGSTPATIEVYSGLYVNEANDLAKAGQEDDSVFSEKVIIKKNNNFRYVPSSNRFLETRIRRLLVRVLEDERKSHFVPVCVY